MADLWKYVFTSYVKDYTILEKWVEELEKLGPEAALEKARQFVLESELVPDVITLGFSPQVLVGALAAKRGKLIVITSPEVKQGRIRSAQLSHRILTLFKDYIEKVIVVDFVPKGDVGTFMEKLIGVFRELPKDTILDISGGTQLVAIAAVLAGKSMLTYSYPTDQGLKFYPITIDDEVLKGSLSLFDIDMSYLYPDAILEVDGILKTKLFEPFLLYEDLSNLNEEWFKIPVRNLISHNLPPSVWKDNQIPLNAIKLSIDLPIFSIENKLKEKYKVDSEKMNLVLYLNFFMPREVRNVMDDLTDKEFDLFEFLETGDCEEDLGFCGNPWIIFVQLGLGSKSQDFIVESIRKLLNICEDGDIEIIFASNEKIRKQVKQLQDKLESKYKISSRRSSDEELGEIIKKYNNPIIINFGDYSKERMKKALDEIMVSGKRTKMLVIPETTYVPKEWIHGGGQHERLVEATSGFLARIRDDYLREFLKYRVVMINV